MLKQRTSTERIYYKNLICQKLSQIRAKFITNNIYFDERSQDIILTLMTGSEIFGTGLTQIYNKKTIKQKQIGKIVIVTYFNDNSRSQIQKVLHLFSEIFIFNLSISEDQSIKSMKVSPIRKKLKGFIQISLNFITYIDSVYHVNKKHDSQLNTTFQQGLTSFLISLPKFYQYQICYKKDQKQANMANKIQNVLKKKLQILQKYKSQEYTESSSPRIKILLINRNIDAMSPLLYSFNFGPISKQLNLLNGIHQFTTNSLLYKTLFPMDIQESSQYLQKLVTQKAQNQKLKFELHQFQKAKQAISMHYDQNISSKQIQLQIEQLDQIKIFCKNKIGTCALQQTILNNRSQEDQKMSVSKIINRILSWIDVPLKQYKPTLDDYVKILILSYMVNSFWFFQRKIINAVVKTSQALSEERKEKIIKYCKKVQDTYSPLKQKVQGQERYDLYRHQPQIIRYIQSWLQKNEEYDFEQLNINKTATKKQNRIIIAINGPLGYNQVAFILNYFRKKQQKSDIIIFCQQLVTSQEYLNILIG